MTKRGRVNYHADSGEGVLETMRIYCAPRSLQSLRAPLPLQITPRAAPLPANWTSWVEKLPYPNFQKH